MNYYSHRARSAFLRMDYAMKDLLEDLDTLEKLRARARTNVLTHWNIRFCPLTGGIQQNPDENLQAPFESGLLCEEVVPVESWRRDSPITI